MQKDKLLAARTPGFCCSPTPHKEGNLFTEQIPEYGPSLIFFDKKEEGGKTVLGFRMTGHWLPSHSIPVAVIHFSGDRHEYNAASITWVMAPSAPPCPLYRKPRGSDKLEVVANYREGVQRFIREFADESRDIIKRQCGECGAQDCGGLCMDEPETGNTLLRLAALPQGGIDGACTSCGGSDCPGCA